MVSKDASFAEIRQAYEECVEQWISTHNRESDEMMKIYNEAYETLSNPAKRSAYDSSLRLSNIIWKNFIVSVWLLIGFCVFEIITNIIYASEVMAKLNGLGRYASGIIAWPFVIGGWELFGWFSSYRDREKGSRIMAVVIGIVLLLQPIVSYLFITNLYGIQFPILEWSFFLYIALSHFGYTIFGREYYDELNE